MFYLSGVYTIAHLGHHYSRGGGAGVAEALCATMLNAGGLTTLFAADANFSFSPGGSKALSDMAVCGLLAAALLTGGKTSWYSFRTLHHCVW